jgi:hypothetical protein
MKPLCVQPGSRFESGPKVLSSDLTPIHPGDASARNERRQLADGVT